MTKASSDGPSTPQGTPSTEAGQPDQVGALRRALHAVELQLDLGRIPPAALHDLKREVDQIRLRVWHLMAAGSAGDAGVLERAQIRRGTDSVHQFAAGLLTGTMDPSHEEWSALLQAMELLQGLLRKPPGG